MSPRTVTQWRQGVADSARVLLVRHPMVRLVSAYRDRVEGMKAAHRVYTHMAAGEGSGWRQKNLCFFCSLKQQIFFTNIF